MVLQERACLLQFLSPLLRLRCREGSRNTRDCKVLASLMEPGPAAHVAQGGARPCGSPSGRQGAVGQSRARPDAATHPPTPFPGGSRAATGGAEARARRGRGRAAPPLCPPPPPARPRGAGAPRLRCPSHAARGLSREQSAAARSRRHVPRPHPRAARPAGTWRHGRRSRRAGPALPRRAPRQRAGESGSEPPPRSARACSEGHGPGSCEPHPETAHAG